MILDEHLDIVERIVNESNGIKAMEMISRVLRECPEIGDLEPIIEELVRTRRIIEVEYILPNMNYRIKSFLLPKNTEVRVRKGSMLTGWL